MTNKEKQLASEAHWDAVWARLKKEGRVDVPPTPREPYFPTSARALAQVAENPGARINVRVVNQNRRGLYGAGGVE